MAIVLVFLGILVPATVIVYVDSKADDTQLTVACTSARSDIAQLKALGKFAKTLGVPVTWTIPELPPECVDS
jgi:hypothetical protein